MGSRLIQSRIIAKPTVAPNIAASSCGGEGAIQPLQSDSISTLMSA